MSCLGKRLRQIRGEHSLNLRQLAEASGVSASMLCTIENGKTMPSVQSLMAIASALRISPSSLFEEETSRYPGGLETVSTENDEVLNPVVRADMRKTIHLSGGIAWSRLTPGSENGIEIAEICYESGASSGAEFYTHSGREWGQIIEGELHIDLAFSSHVLKVGDSITFSSQTPHRLRNEGTETMRAIWVNYR